VLRCGTSVGANYRAACRAKSPAGFVAKMASVEEECDESIYWMELISEAGLMDEKRLVDLKNEANEILSMVVASIKPHDHANNPQSHLPPFPFDYEGERLPGELHETLVPEHEHGHGLQRERAAGSLSAGSTHRQAAPAQRSSYLPEGSSKRLVGTPPATAGGCAWTPCTSSRTG